MLPGYFAIFNSTLELMKFLSKEEKGTVIENGIRYYETGEKTEEENQAVAIVCVALYRDIDTMSEKYEKRVEASRTAARSRWVKANPDTDSGDHRAEGGDKSCERIQEKEKKKKSKSKREGEGKEKDKENPTLRERGRKRTAPRSKKVSVPETTPAPAPEEADSRRDTGDANIRAAGSGGEDGDSDVFSEVSEPVALPRWSAVFSDMNGGYGDDGAFFPPRGSREWEENDAPPRSLPSRSAGLPSGGEDGPYGRFGNVRLTGEQLADLKEEMPEVYEEYIEKLSSYMASTGKSYRDCFATILRWYEKDRADGSVPVRKASSFDTDEFMEAAFAHSRKTLPVFSDDPGAA